MGDETERAEVAPNLRVAAYDKFLDALRTGALAPGQMLNQKSLAGDLGLSIGTLRELLPRLEAEGLVQVLNQRGIFLPAIDLTMIRETFQLRLALEREAAAAAADDLDAGVVATLRAGHVAAREAVEREGSPAALERCEEVDAGLHETLIAATQNALLQRAYATNATRMRLIKLYRHPLSARYMLGAMDDHLAVIDAIAARDRVAAMTAMERHIRHARDRAVQL